MVPAMPNLQRFRPQPDQRLTFLNQFFRRPGLVGSVIPSSRFLERRIVSIAQVSHAKSVVELGPGTGGTTRAVLRALPASSRLLAIELNAQFAALLDDLPDPRLSVEYGGAAEIRDALDTHGMERPDVILSGIPFSTMPAAGGRGIIEKVWSSLVPGGRFVAYQFRDRVSVLGKQIIGAPKVEVELFNVPPMRLYCWRKPK
jgi:phosphatidylethanolamine/phosphatidyl-N-methylethanolamine N-methyltransferase